MTPKIHYWMAFIIPGYACVVCVSVTVWSIEWPNRYQRIAVRMASLFMMTLLLGIMYHMIWEAPYVHSNSTFQW
jgi:hypothetical protein